MYMEKLIVGPGAKGTIDLNLPLADNPRNVAAGLGKPWSELKVTNLDITVHQDAVS
ncbi:fructose 1,6-bisphosphatase II [Escherichia coli]|nr:fructose 1,6-bisphosphatase II [Escherichia coli]